MLVDLVATPQPDKQRDKFLVFSLPADSPPREGEASCVTSTLGKARAWTGCGEAIASPPPAWLSGEFADRSRKAVRDKRLRGRLGYSTEIFDCAGKLFTRRQGDAEDASCCAIPGIIGKACAYRRASCSAALQLRGKRANTLFRSSANKPSLMLRLSLSLSAAPTLRVRLFRGTTRQFRGLSPRFPCARLRCRREWASGSSRDAASTAKALACCACRSRCSRH